MQILIFFSLFIAFVYIREYWGKAIRNKFFNSASNAIVIDSSTYHGNYWIYSLSDELEIDCQSHYNGKYQPGKIDINVGDSISKNAKTYQFEVYKKDVFGKYIFHKSFNLDEDW